MKKIDTVRRTIEFGKPDYLPYELLDVPGIYTAYDTIDPETVRFIPGTEDFDALWVGYNWTLTDLGKNEKGEPLRRDEWGVEYKVPEDTDSAYVILKSPLREGGIDNYRIPDPSVSDPFFERTKRVIEERYPDRFVTGYVDPGPFLVAFLSGAGMCPRTGMHP